MTRWMWKVSSYAAAIAMASGMLFAQASSGDQAPPGVPMDSSTSPIVSPTVVATIMVRTLDGASAVRLLVFWRGSNGWFVKSGPRGSGGGGSQATVTARASFGGVNLLAELDPEPRAVRIQGNPVPLKPIDANVILVDGVDGPDLRVVATLKIDPAMPSSREIAPLLKRSPEIVAFLQCDQKASHPAVIILVERSCQSVMGK